MEPSNECAVSAYSGTYIPCEYKLLSDFYVLGDRLWQRRSRTTKSVVVITRPLKSRVADRKRDQNGKLEKRFQFGVQTVLFLRGWKLTRVSAETRKYFGAERTLYNISVIFVSEIIILRNPWFRVFLCFQV